MYGLLQASSTVGVGVEGSFEALPCMAAIVRDGLVVASNGILRRMTGLTSGATHLTSLLNDAELLGDGVRRQRFDCLLCRSYGEPIGVSVAVQSCAWMGQTCLLLLMMERLDQASGILGEGTFLADVLDAAPEATVITHEGRVLHLNREFTRVFGYTEAECMGQDLDGLLVPDELLADNEVITHELQQDGRSSLETVRRTRSGEAIDVSLLVSRVRLGGETVGLLITYRDIRRQKREEARLQFTALHDGLTGLANRVLFMDRLTLTMARLRRRPDRSFAVVFLDLDGFKRVNDTLGHAAGDELLIVIAKRLVDCLRPQDTVARFGGDEFALLLDESGSLDEVERVSLRLLVAIGETIPLSGATAHVSASLGIVQGNRGYPAAEDLLRDADEAMYRAKTQGKARYVVFERELEAA